MAVPKADAPDKHLSLLALERISVAVSASTLAVEDPSTTRRRSPTISSIALELDRGAVHEACVRSRPGCNSLQ